jgi:creatinine amidohydrolase
MLRPWHDGRVEIPLFERPHAEARRLIATGAPVYLTVNPVEYHGPHLSLHNDRLVSRGLAGDLHRALVARGHDWPFLLGADLEVGVEPTPGPGSRHTRYAQARALVVEACRALAELGATKVVLLTFHGQPLHNLALQAGVDWLAARGVAALAPFHLVLRELLMFEDAAPFAEALAPIAAAEDRAAVARELKYDFHAGFFETSVAMHYAPASVSEIHRQLPPCPPVTPNPTFLLASRLARACRRPMLSRELELAAVGYGWTTLRPFPGYTGRPHLASPEAGAVFARKIIEGYRPVVEAVFEGREPAPRPIMAWVGRVSGGGRIGGVPRPAPSDCAPAPGS